MPMILPYKYGIFSMHLGLGIWTFLNILDIFDYLRDFLDTLVTFLPGELSSGYQPTTKDILRHFRSILGHLLTF